MKNIMWLSSSEVTRKLDISLRQLYYWEEIIEGYGAPAYDHDGIARVQTLFGSRF